ncbi:GNAT family N-acetyltransferase [Namhaeicola litoreus]|uniref:GNAT family N-acetyltransferase n=1 Tax=Namhaeicola litoreus TaxID=1052145 RepID=A0ABW3Y216_9FLAO
MKTTYVEASKPEDFVLIENLAHEIWHEYYPEIIGLEQVVYMLKKFQNSTYMQHQVQESFVYFLIYREDHPAGYLSYQIQKDQLFLSKMYLLDKFRGQKIGKESLDFVEENAVALQLPKIRLTVNKDNLNAIKAYESAGFVNYGEAVTDISDGFVMDDYLMEKNIELKR